MLETEEMNDTAIEQALVNVAQHGIHVQVILQVLGTYSILILQQLKSILLSQV